MSTKTTHHCDVCDRRVDYFDGDGDQAIMGFKFSVLTQAQPPLIQVSNHVHDRGGHHSSHIPELAIPENICSPECLQNYFADWVGGVRVAWGAQRHWEPPQ